VNYAASPAGQILPNKIASFYSSESGLFGRLRRKKTKIAVFLILAAGPPERPRFDPASGTR
jgi:hypothetical protein